MFFSKGNKQHERYYLLPGQGGQAARRKHRRFIKWSIVVGLVTSTLLALIMYLFDRAKPF